MSKQFEGQVRVQLKDGQSEFRSVCPTGGKPYRYAKRENAMGMLRSCYPDCVVEDVRVIEVIDDDRETMD